MTDQEQLGNNEYNYHSSLIFVKRVFPYNDTRVQEEQAKAVYEITKVFMEQILPSVINRNLAFSNN